MAYQTVIMVQMADRSWTMEALHCAARMARQQAAKVVLVAVVPVVHPSWVGTEWGYLNFTEQDRANLEDYLATFEDYGVPCESLVFQYVSLVGAIVQVAEHLNAQTVFARLPESVLPFWTRLQGWLLHRQLAQQNRQWIEHLTADSETPSRVQPVSTNRHLPKHPVS